MTLEEQFIQFYPEYVKRGRPLHPYIDLFKNGYAQATWNYSENEYIKELESKQLSKAKELLTRFVMASVYFNGKETDLIKEAEKFLKEIK